MGTVMRVKMYVRLGRENIYRCFKEEEEEEEEKKKILSRLLKSRIPEIRRARIRKWQI